MVRNDIGGTALQTVEDIEGLYDACKGNAYGLAFQILRDQTAAEDVVQDAFLAAWRSRDRYDPAKGPLRAWLLMIVRNRAIDRLRHDRASAGREVDLDAAPVIVDDGADPAAAGPDRLWVTEALKFLPAAQRDVILLAFFGGYTHTQIAARQGLPLGTVKGQLRLALEKLSVLELTSSAGKWRA